MAPPNPPIPALPPLTRAESEALGRRRRGRNIAMLVGLLALAAAFYAIAVVKFLHPGAVSP